MSESASKHRGRQMEEQSRKRKTPRSLSESSSSEEEKQASKIQKTERNAPAPDRRERNAAASASGRDRNFKASESLGRNSTALERPERNSTGLERPERTSTGLERPERTSTGLERPERTSTTTERQEREYSHSHHDRNQHQRRPSGQNNYSHNSSGSSYYGESSFNRDSSYFDQALTPDHSGQQQQQQRGRDVDEGLAPVVARHYNEIEEKGLEAREESKIVTLRKYNNWAKSMNFNDAMDEFRKDGRRYNTLVGLDLCCGKGGDLRKWEKSKMMSHVVFVDIAEVSLTNCKERYEDMKRKHEEQLRKRGRGPPLFTAEFFVADCTKESVRSKMSDPNMPFDMVSCQFSFHYCFESLPQAQQMLRNVTDNLVSGGYFIGTLPNADRIVKRRNNCGASEFGNEVYKVHFECDDPYPVFGARYFFELQDAISCPEFLVNFPSFESMADSFGLRLVYRHPLEEFHTIHGGRHEGQNLLNGMGALETYPPFPGEKLHFDERHYAHAQEYIDKMKEKDPNRRDVIRVGTISAVEWEAIRLYIAFCFRKK